VKRAKKAKYVYDIDFSGEMGAGLRAFTDTVTVEVGSGDPGGDEDEFAEHVQNALADWFDGASVERIPKPRKGDGK
jgi:nitrous oxide reductase accessory protein NosL